MQLLYTKDELTFHSVSATLKLEKLPKFQMRVECGGSTTGFANPADDYIETHLDLHQYHNVRRHVCFFVEAIGDSMIDAGITENDLLIVDTSLDYRAGDIVICAINGTYKAKVIQRIEGRLFLISKNPAFKPIEIQEQDDFTVFGVVKGFSRNFRRFLAMWYGLADGNNFYCSCERAFNPHLEGKPIVVLSNNDGCIISRSNEAKALGIKMGAPIFQVKDLVQRHGISVFSSNYTLYGDMSARMMNALAELCPVVEVYSIDEAFLDLSIIPLHELEPLAHQVRSTVRKWTKIPTCIGIAQTKTLAKLANKIAKKNPALGGVFVIGDDQMRRQALGAFPIEDVWGIGRQHAKFLLSCGITTALQLAEMPDEWVKLNFSVVGVRLVHELRGLSCLPMLEPREMSQNICTSRSFGTPQNTLDGLSEAVSTFAATVGEKLRAQGACATTLTVFVQTNRFREDQAQYSNSTTINLPVGASNASELVKYALQGLKAIYRPNFLYKKAGVIVAGIVPADRVQTDLFDTTDRERLNRASAAMDQLNARFGRGVVHLAVQGTHRQWLPKFERRSPCFTTQWGELLKVELS